MQKELDIKTKDWPDQNQELLEKDCVGCQGYIWIGRLAND